MVTVNFWRGYLRRIEVASGKKMNARNKETLGFLLIILFWFLLIFKASVSKCKQDGKWQKTHIDI